ICDLGATLKDFSKTAAAVMSMEVILTVDTAMAHLAGALGKPVWVLIPQGNDWRWLHARKDSPWYGSMRLFRQGRNRDWTPTMGSVRSVLEQFVASANTKTTTTTAPKDS
ncbi:MAG: hypothetical protein RLN70_12115, partial [Rhodospirillaceae bacterium]